MSVLLVGAAGQVGEAVIARLRGQGDEVRVIEPDDAAAERWRHLGAHVARGTAADADLVERAAQSCRTIVVLGEAPLEPVLLGASAAGVDRLVVCAPDFDEQGFESGRLDFVVLVVPRSRFSKRSTVPPDVVAAAVDAADDLAGNPKMYVNLADESQWSRLGLSPESS